MKRNIMKTLAALAVIAFFWSCESEYKKEYSWAYPLCGDWTVNAYIGEDNIYGPFEIKSYNSSFGKDSIWFDDYPNAAATSANFWAMKYKVAVDLQEKTFQTTGSINALTPYPIEIIVSDGKVIGNDSIIFKIKFEDDPGTTYTIAGHRTTSYEEYMGSH